MMETREYEAQKPAFDFLTLVAKSVLAYLFATMLHEHLGHALAALLLGAPLTELGAFYVAYNSDLLSDLSRRIVDLAGPGMSFLTGLVGFVLLGRFLKASSQLKYFLWLFGSISLLTATGYMLFSGVSGLGDFGNTPDGATFQLEPAWLWRILLIVIGGASYFLVARFSAGKMNILIGGEGSERIRRAQTFAVFSYLSGALASILTGLLNPYGMIIVLISAMASSIGGTSGLLWMMQFLKGMKPGGGLPFQLGRKWSWIVIGFVFMLLYGLLLGPSIML
jgi:hypothetical protein